MAQRPQIVIYRPAEDQEPTWQFYSMPVSIVGGGSALEEARKQILRGLQLHAGRFGLSARRGSRVRGARN